MSDNHKNKTNWLLPSLLNAAAPLERPVLPSLVPVFMLELTHNHVAQPDADATSEPGAT